MPRCALAGIEPASDSAGDGFCNTSGHGHAAGPTSTTFGFFNSIAYANGFRSCSGSACKWVYRRGIEWEWHVCALPRSHTRHNRCYRDSRLCDWKLMAIGTYTGSPDSSSNWVGQSSGAIFAPSAVPPVQTATIVAQTPTAWLWECALVKRAWIEFELRSRGSQ